MTLFQILTPSLLPLFTCPITFNEFRDIDLLTIFHIFWIVSSSCFSPIISLISSRRESQVDLLESMALMSDAGSLGINAKIRFESLNLAAFLYKVDNFLSSSLGKSTGLLPIPMFSMCLARINVDCSLGNNFSFSSAKLLASSHS